MGAVAGFTSESPPPAAKILIHVLMRIYRLDFRLPARDLSNVINLLRAGVIASEKSDYAVESQAGAHEPRLEPRYPSLICPADS